MNFLINRCSMEDVEQTNFDKIIRKNDIHYIEINTLEELLKLLQNSYSDYPDFGGLVLSKKENEFQITIRDFYYE